MLPSNLLNALKEYALAQRTLPQVTPVEAAAKTAQQFELGQKVQASVQAQVAPNVFKVNVSGQLIQMQLPPNIRSGDTVSLQVVSLQPKLTFSMAASANPLSTPEQLGATARLLSSMSQQAPEKAYVKAAQSAPLWESPQPPEGKQLAGALREALGNSGLFYESHQAQWVGGERSIAQLMHEPQNLTPEQARMAAGGKVPVEGEAAARAAQDAVARSGPEVASKVAPDSANKTLPETPAGLPASDEGTAQAATLRQAADANSSTQPGSTSQPESKPLNIPEHLQPLVQQQLNALETRQMLWQGNVWPGQEMQWEIHEETPRGQAGEEQRQWVTQIRLDLPNLGAVTATLRFTGAGLNLALSADSPQTRALLGGASGRLVSALSDAGVPVLGTQVSSGVPQGGGHE